MAFFACSGDLKSAFITEADIVDRYIGTQLWGWGGNSSGSLGNNAGTSRSSPVQTIAGGANWVQASVGSGIKSDGTLWTWGGNTFGWLGNNSTLPLSSPIQTIAGGTNWKQLDGTAAIKTDGTLWLWGSNSCGQLGDNTIISASSPIQTISGGTNWRQVSVGGSSTGSIKTDGTLWLWGSNVSGRLGNNSTLPQSSPIQTIAGGNNWKQVSLGLFLVGAIKTDGTLWAWGGSNLGNNLNITRSSPVQTIAGGTNWKSVSSGRNSAAAIKTDGTLWTWGTNTCGVLAINDTITVSVSSPIQTIAGGTNWKSVDLGTNWSGAAIKTDGTLWVWGNGSGGTLGNNALVDVSSPIQTIAGGTNWKQVRVGSGDMAALSIT